MKIYEITFSPTGGTSRVADVLAGGLGGTVVPVDLTDRRTAFETVTLTPEDAAVIAVPSYGGRVPAVAAQRLARIGGNGAQAVLVCVYGNRAYEDTPAELRDIAAAAGFRTVAAVAAVAEHSIVRQIAAGRPDDADRAELAAFAERIKSRLEEQHPAEPALPGNRPYKQSGHSGMAPEPTADCVRCGVCAAQCPVGAIDPADPGRIDRAACVSCMRCASVCPRAARRLDGGMLAGVGAMLAKVCVGRQPNELFLWPAGRSGMDCELIRATPDDVAEIFPLYERAVEWMDVAGIRQWNVNGYLEAYPAAYYRDAAAEGRLYALRRAAEGRIVAAIVVRDEDEAWDGLPPAAAFYLHNLVAARDEPGAGGVLLTRMEDAARRAGRTCLRMDCDATNGPLNRYYERRGFVPRGTCTDGPYYSGIMRERVL